MVVGNIFLGNFHCFPWCSCMPEITNSKILIYLNTFNLFYFFPFAHRVASRLPFLFMSVGLKISSFISSQSSLFWESCPWWQNGHRWLFHAAAACGKLGRGCTRYQKGSLGRKQVAVYQHAGLQVELVTRKRREVTKSAHSPHFETIWTNLKTAKSI